VITYTDKLIVKLLSVLSFKTASNRLTNLKGTNIKPKQEGKSKKVKGKSKNQEISSPEQFFMPDNFYSSAYVF